MESDSHWYGTPKSYVVGYILSLVLTITAYLIVVEHLLPNQAIIFTILALATVQALVQLIFFLHLDKEPKPRPNLLTFLLTVVIVAILVLGSLWIMYNLNYRMGM